MYIEKLKRKNGRFTGRDQFCGFKKMIVFCELLDE